MGLSAAHLVMAVHAAILVIPRGVGEGGKRWPASAYSNVRQMH